MTETVPTVGAKAPLDGETLAWIGRTTDLVALPEEISASDIRRYVEATGDRNPLWFDDESARKAGHARRLVPPMMVVDLNRRLESTPAGRLWHHLPLPAEYSQTRNAGMETEWLAPVHVGDRLRLRYRIVGIVARQGRRGLGIYVSYDTEYFNQDSVLVALVHQTVVRLPESKAEAK